MINQTGFQESVIFVSHHVFAFNVLSLVDNHARPFTVLGSPSTVRNQGGSEKRPAAARLRPFASAHAMVVNYAAGEPAYGEVSGSSIIGPCPVLQSYSVGYHFNLVPYVSVIILSMALPLVRRQAIFCYYIVYIIFHALYHIITASQHIFGRLN
jgi:hypothetical protein